MKITKQQWDKIGPLLNTALELDAITREQWLAGIAQTDQEIAPLLKQMLATHDQAERASELETVPKLAPPPPSSLFHAGDMIGAYRLVLPLGRGGMGEVWLADQADGRITRQVALKLPTQVQHLAVWRRRFQRERDILAKLTHPNIARLFDAGVDDKLSRIGIGQPYLALEYVEGQPLNEYADAKSLPIAARLKLFRQVLAATTHAHQHLVVHRDLKPGNILVTASGEVKLLDFGIAKLIDDAATQTTDDSSAAQHPSSPSSQSSTELTRIGGRVMTLRYAAPEQVTGDAITTATDVYALGVILHELITGVSPYRATREAKRLTEAALTDEPTSVPSALNFSLDDVHKRGLRTARQLTQQVAGDLDAIVLKAMRKQPDERYLSVTALDDDVRRHLEGNPVHARKGTWRYLAGRFVMRHKIPMAAAALVLITIMGGLIAVDQERRVAVAERERAERHFRSVRAMANSLMFDVHDQIDHLPGATKAKQVLVENASKYLAQLSNESKLDTPLSIELAKAYARLADIQGQNDFSNIGKPDAALANYQRVVELLAPIARPVIKPTSSTDLESAHIADYELSKAYRKIGGIQRAMGKLEPAYASSKTGAEFALRASQSANATLENKTLHVVMDYERERSLAGLRKDRSIRLKGATDAVAAMEVLRLSNPDDRDLLDRLAWCYSENGHALRDDQDPEVKRQAIKKYEMALAIREAALLKAPNDVTLQRAILSHHNALGHTYTQLREFDNAIKHLRAADDSMVRISLQDVGNVQFNSDAVQTIASLADAQQAAGDNRAAQVSADEGLKRLAALPGEARALRRTVAAEASLQKIIGEVTLYEATKMQAASPQSSDKIIQKFIAAREAFVAAIKAISQGTPTTGYEKKRVAVIADMQKQIDDIDRRLMRLKTKR